jgi:hypothetical protein
MTVRGTIEVGKNSVIYMGLIPGPNKADNLCGKMTVTGRMHRGSTVYPQFVFKTYGNSDYVIFEL